MPDGPRQFDAPVLLSEGHDGSSFACGEPVLDDWLRQRAWPNLQNGASRTYVVCPAGTARIAGYVSLSMGHILARDVTAAMRRNMPSHVPVVTLGRLAIDRAWHGNGLGQALLADAIRRIERAADEVAARLILVHALSPAAEDFYRHHGFTRLPVETPTLALDLVKLRKLRDRP